jgi:uncharacterized protein (UPF0335 family)
MTTNFDAPRLKSLVQRIEKLEEERQGIGNDIKEVYSEAKSAGYTPKIIREVIRKRKLDKADREEQLEMFTLYFDAVTP